MKSKNTLLQLVKRNGNVELNSKSNSNTKVKFQKFTIKEDTTKSVKGGLVVTDVLSF